MTLQQLQSSLSRYIPNVRVRQGGYADVAAVFQGSSYLLRLNKGEQHLYNWRESIIVTDEDRYLLGKGRAIPKGPKHRGRMQMLAMLVNMRWLNARQAQRVMWGL
jgi:hypothetical protein